MERYDLAALVEDHARSDKLYEEIVRTHDLSVGLYVLPVGAADPQGPHTEDEVYHVVAGRARLLVEEDDQPVGPGTIVFVPADAVHRFHDVEEELVALVFFGPAEYTHRTDHHLGRPHGAARA